jgi:3',5'-cyclic AMP phosphodiesterase CpdA
MLVAHLSDTHVALPGAGLVQFVDGGERLRWALDALATLDPDPDVLLVTGDLVDRGVADEYGLLRELLGIIDIPTYLIPGNHDDRETMVHGLPDHRYLPRDGAPLAFTVDDFAVRLVGLDTLRDGYHDGDLDDARLRWLDDTLDRAPDVPTLVFMHHPPFATGIWWMDAQGLRAREPFAEIVSRHPHVQRIIAGHVHHYADGTVSGVPCTTAPGTSYQAVVDFSADRSPRISNAIGAILLYDFRDGDCIVHYMPYGSSPMVLDFATIVADYPAFAAKLRSGEGLPKTGFGM